MCYIESKSLPLFIYRMQYVVYLVEYGKFAESPPDKSSYGIAQEKRRSKMVGKKIFSPPADYAHCFSN